VDGTSLTASGLPNAIAVIALAEGRGSMYAPGSLVYMDKIAVGPEAAGAIDLQAPVQENLRRVAKANGKEMNDLRVLILDRPRNQPHIEAARESGARISLFRDGDVAGAIATAQEDHEADILLGIGGSPEAVIAAAALRCVGGEIQCRLWPRDDSEVQLARDAGLDLDQVLTTDDLVNSDNIFFAATGVTNGEFLRGVNFRGEERAVTHSVIMRSKTGSVRYMTAVHNLERLRAMSNLTVD
jgi:fructose-1,6-bisphosphatase II